MANPRKSKSEKNKSEKVSIDKPYDDTMLLKELDSLGHGLADKLYYKILMLYMRKQVPFGKSDVIIWKGTFFVVPTWIGYISFAALFGWFFIKLYDKYGISRMLSFIAILILWRLNMAIKLFNDMNKNIKDLIKKFP